MMNCWKAINLNKQYGTQRVIMLSFLTMLFSFILLYVPATYVFVPNSFHDQYFLFLIIGLWLMYPIHKFFHWLPLIPTKNKVKKAIVLKYLIFPVIQIRIAEPIMKWTFLLSLLTPFFVINSLLVALSFIYSGYIHYFIILLAYHIGLCVSDFICTKNVLRTPNHAYIEESDDGFEVLVNHSHNLSH